jgi:hypothetical protein
MALQAKQKARPDNVLTFPKPYETRPVIGGRRHDIKKPEPKARPAPKKLCKPQAGPYNPHLCLSCALLPRCWDKQLKTYTGIPNAIYDRYRASWAPSVWAVLLDILRHTNTRPSHKNFGLCFKSRARIAKDCNLNRYTVTKATNMLHEAGVVTKTLLEYRDKNQRFKNKQILTVQFLRALRPVFIAAAAGELDKFSHKNRALVCSRGEPIKPRKLVK